MRLQDIDPVGVQFVQHLPQHAVDGAGVVRSSVRILSIFRSVILSFVFWLYANQAVMITPIALMIGAMYSIVLSIKKGAVILVVLETVFMPFFKRLPCPH